MEDSPKAMKKKTPIQQVAGNSATADIWTIWYAAQYGKLARVRSLLDRQAVASIDVQEYRTRWSPLHFACRYGHSSVVEHLVARGANVNLQDWQGNTPLHLSAGWGDLRCVIVVLEGGADVRGKNKAGQTPSDVAIELARKDHVRLLSDWKPLGYTAEELAQYRQQFAASDTALQLLNLALAEEPSPAIRLELHALHSKRRGFGDSHPGLLGTYSKLLTLYRDGAQLVRALEMADHGLTLCEAMHGRNHVETVRWLTALGELLLLQNKSEEAVHCLTEAHSTLISVNGETDPETIIALENLGIACQEADQRESAETYLRTLLRLLTERYGGGYNAKFFHLMMRLAFVVLSQKRVEEARAVYMKCLPHAENLFGATDDHTVACTDALGKCHFLLGDFQAAETYFKRSIAALLHPPSPSALEGVADAKQERFRRAHSNLAMVAVAARSARAVREQLQHLGYR